MPNAVHRRIVWTAASSGREDARVRRGGKVYDGCKNLNFLEVHRENRHCLSRRCKTEIISGRFTPRRCERAKITFSLLRWRKIPLRSRSVEKVSRRKPRRLSTRFFTKCKSARPIRTRASSFSGNVRWAVAIIVGGEWCILRLTSDTGTSAPSSICFHYGKKYLRTTSFHNTPTRCSVELNPWINVDSGNGRSTK